MNKPNKDMLNGLRTDYLMRRTMELGRDPSEKEQLAFTTGLNTRINLENVLLDIETLNKDVFDSYYVHWLLEHDNEPSDEETYGFIIGLVTRINLEKILSGL